MRIHLFNNFAKHHRSQSGFAIQLNRSNLSFFFNSRFGDPNFLILGARFDFRKRNLSKMEQNRYRCHFCPFKDEMDLKSMRKHNAIDHWDCYFLCAECVNVFKTEQHLAEHDRSQHGFEEEDITVVCIHCPQPKQFKNAEALKVHSKSKHGHSKFICGRCFNWFSVERFRDIHRNNCKVP